MTIVNLKVRLLALVIFDVALLLILRMSCVFPLLRIDMVLDSCSLLVLAIGTLIGVSGFIDIEVEESSAIHEIVRKSRGYFFLNCKFSHEVNF